MLLHFTQGLLLCSDISLFHPFITGHLTRSKQVSADAEMVPVLSVAVVPQTIHVWVHSLFLHLKYSQTPLIFISCSKPSHKSSYLLQVGRVSFVDAGMNPGISVSFNPSPLPNLGLNIFYSWRKDWAGLKTQQEPSQEPFPAFQPWNSSISISFTVIPTPSYLLQVCEFLLQML